MLQGRLFYYDVMMVNFVTMVSHGEYCDLYKFCQTYRTSVIDLGLSEVIEICNL